jgi:small subunit ribosomal protein S11
MAEDQEKTAASGTEENKPVKDEAQKTAAAAAEGAGEASEESTSQTAPAAGAPRKARRAARVSPVGIAHIKSTFNNTIVSISDAKGNVVSWNSAGRAGFKGSRKSTAFAATVVAQDAARQAAAKGMHEVEIRVQGAGTGRESAIRAIQSAGLVITMIRDVTPIPHNGCRPRKRRRV